MNFNPLSNYQKKTFKNIDPLPFRRLRNFFFSFLVSQMRRSQKTLRRVTLLAERIEWINWVEEQFPDSKFYYSREAIWDKLKTLMQKRSSWRVYEFGVAYGYTTNYWLSSRSSEIVCWNGFDRFLGLPRPWRDLPMNAFEANGRPPEIEDPRVTWFVGNVEDQLPKVKIEFGPNLIIFDLDVYEPTEFAWSFLLPHLHPGDLVYFDEAYDSDERRVITDNVQKHFALETVGFTHTAIAFKLGLRIAVKAAGIDNDTDLQCT